VVSQEADPDDIAREERAIYAIIVAAGAPVIVAAAIQGGTIDSGTTLCIVIVVVGLFGLWWRLRSRDRLPRATQLRRASGTRRPPR
jgi:hypothetical protein